LGVLVLYNFFNMVIIRKMDLATLVPADQLAAAHAQVSAYWSAPWYFTLLGAVERFLTIPLQICFAVIVLQTFVRRQWFWVWLAVLYHALADMTVVIANNLVSYYWTEVIIMIFTVISVVIIFALRQPEPPENIVAPAHVPTEFKLKPPEETMENLDKTRYR
jgi:uncharacterized membrane protein YhfC